MIYKKQLSDLYNPLYTWNGYEEANKKNHTCPHCGHCPTCGRGPYTFPSYPVYPTYQTHPSIQPWITYCGSEAR